MICKVEQTGRAEHDLWGQRDDNHVGRSRPGCVISLVPHLVTGSSDPARASSKTSSLCRGLEQDPPPAPSCPSR